MGGIGRATGIAFGQPRPFGHIDLAPENRLDFGSPCGLIELDGPEHVAMVGDGQRGHFQHARPLDQIADFDGAVKQTVLRMQMKVYKRCLAHELSDPQ